MNNLPISILNSMSSRPSLKLRDDVVFSVCTLTSTNVDRGGNGGAGGCRSEELGSIKSFHETHSNSFLLSQNYGTNINLT